MHWTSDLQKCNVINPWERCYSSGSKLLHYILGAISLSGKSAEALVPPDYILGLKSDRSGLESWLCIH